MPMEKTRVIFRKWPDGAIIALFPLIPDDRRGYTCVSYEHVGQHGGADDTAVVRLTKPAKPAEFAALAAELRGRGYVLDIRARVPRDALEKRRAYLTRAGQLAGVSPGA